MRPVTWTGMSLAAAQMEKSTYQSSLILQYNYTTYGLQIRQKLAFLDSTAAQ